VIGVLGKAAAMIAMITMIATLRERGAAELLAYAEPDRTWVMWRSDSVSVAALDRGVVGALPFLGEHTPDLFVPEHIVCVNHADRDDVPMAGTVCASDHDRDPDRALPGSRVAIAG
jgi:hypothetical protein